MDTLMVEYFAKRNVRNVTTQPIISLKRNGGVGGEGLTLERRFVLTKSVNSFTKPNA